MKEMARLTILAVLLIAIFYVWQNRTAFAFTKSEAIALAKEWSPVPEPGSRFPFCGSAMTPAIHKMSGAEYTFGTTCIPPGWVRTKQIYLLPEDR